ncbi:MAG: hypothetical protein GX575_22390 [Candidatus Anammoximicrobium sp.]|nr:hypothetical protein [Candidatus Anammoximicrobium sp.]
MSQRTVIRVLWTGGFDSSNRMVQLSRRQVCIQPYYLSGNRRSKQRELNSIAAVARDIQEHPDTVCTILPLITVRLEDIGPDREITAAHRRLRRATEIGSQYDCLARFAKTVAGLELCLEKAESSKALNCILKYGALKLEHEVLNDPYCVIDKDRSSQDLIRVFGAFRFPVIDKTKLELVEGFRQLGFEQTMHKTWFCFTPVNGEPCGACNPCRSAIEEGMRFRFTDAALKRYGNWTRTWLANKTVRGLLSRLQLLEVADFLWKQWARRRRPS